MRAGFAIAGSVLVLSACGRVHPLKDGDYAFRMTEAVRDDCGLATTPGVISTGTLKTTGHVVSFSYGFLDLEMVGNYLTSLEQMSLDGTAVNVNATVRGQACLLDTATIHLDATTRSATTFDGLMSIGFTARQSTQCVCQFWFKVEATRTGGPP